MVADSRKIAAILAADVVGYSRLMVVDEQGALAILKVRRTIFDRLVKDFDGQEFGSIGDSLMAQFPSAINAVRCALNLQHAISEENDSLPPDRRMALRIGVNLGHVIEENGVLFGDGVNIAARLQALATPGGVLVSGAVYEQVKNKLSASFTFVGARQVKNIPEAVACYEVTEPVVTSFAQRVAARFDRRYRLWLVAAVAGVAAIAAMASWPWWGAADEDRNAPNGPEEKSIAVLPFLDMSAGKDQEYFSDGISEELLHLLAKIPELRVTSRSSAFSFKGQNLDVSEIGRQLNVSHILEGSVRTSGNQVRITAQLIDTRSDAHLWSETYDRPLGNIFSVQDEIAGAVVAQLKLNLLGPALATRPDPPDPEAYNLVLQGRYFLEREGRDGLGRAIDYFRQARERDPGYAPAWAGLSLAYMLQAGSGIVPVADGNRRAREAAKTALALDPQLGDAHLAMGVIHLYYDWDWAAADASFRRALELEPGNARTLIHFGNLARTFGRWDEAIDATNKSIERDPLVPDGYAHRGLILLAINRDTEAESALRQALEHDPAGEFRHLVIGRSLLLQGKHEAALREIQREVDESWRMSGLPLVYHALGRRSESDAALEALKSQHGGEMAYQIAEAHAFRGETDLAFEWLGRAYAQRDAGLVGIIGNRFFRTLIGDPRYADFLKKMNLPESNDHA